MVVLDTISGMRDISMLKALIAKYAGKARGWMKWESVKDGESYLRSKFEQYAWADLASVLDPHIVAGLLKMYVRELSEPLLTFELVCFIAAPATF